MSAEDDSRESRIWELWGAGPRPTEPCGADGVAIPLPRCPLDDRLPG